MSSFAFLMLIVVLAVAGAAAVIVLRGKKGAQAPCPKPPTDPYLIAYLSGGAETAVRIAIFQVCQAGLLTAVAGRLKRAKPDAASQCSNDLERSIVTVVGESLGVDTVLKDPGVLRAAHTLRGSLIGEQLLADDSLRGANRMLAIIVGGIVVAVTVLAIILGLMQDDKGVGDLFTALVGVAVVFGGLVALTPRVTPRGNHALTILRQRFQQTAQKKSSAGGSESLIIAAIFGFDALPPTEQPLARVIFYKGKK